MKQYYIQKILGITTVANKKNVETKNYFTMYFETI